MGSKSESRNELRYLLNLRIFLQDTESPDERLEKFPWNLFRVIKLCHLSKSNFEKDAAKNHVSQ